MRSHTTHYRVVCLRIQYGRRDCQMTRVRQPRHHSHRQICQHQAHHKQSMISAVQIFGIGLHSPKMHVAPKAYCSFRGDLSSMAAESTSAINQYTGVRMMQLSLGTQRLSPFTEVVYRRGPRRWLGLRKGHYVRIERPAPWLLGIPLPPIPSLTNLALEVQQHIEDASRRFSQIPNSMADLQHQLLSIRHVTVPQLLTAAAVVAGLLLIALLMQRAFQQQRRRQAQPQEDLEVLARKAASLDQQRSRFRRALGGEEDVPAQDPVLASESSATTASTAPDLPTDQGGAVGDRGLDDFDAWDEDTQKQWKRFMKGSRSQEIDEEQWWDIDRDELPADRHVYQNFN